MTEGIHYNAKGDPISFSGKDAVDYYAATLLWSHLKLYKKTGMLPTRGFGLRKMLDRASDYTGEKYKNNQIDKAIEDLDQWAKAMRLALPESQDK